jgi:hypothetical protein
MTAQELIDRAQRTLDRFEDLLNDDQPPSPVFLERVFRDFDICLMLAQGVTDGEIHLYATEEDDNEAA